MASSRDNNNIILDNTVVFNKTLCIICQLNNRKLTQTESGCAKVRWAASQRKDIVHSRINTLNNICEYT